MKESEIRKAAKDGVCEALKLYGFTVNKPNEMQKDMQHLRSLRLGCEATKRNILKAFITVIVPSALYIIWETFKHSVIK